MIGLVPAIDAAMRRRLAEAKGLKLGKLAQPLRAALTGRTSLVTWHF